MLIREGERDAGGVDFIWTAHWETSDVVLRSPFAWRWCPTSKKKRNVYLFIHISIMHNRLCAFDCVHVGPFHPTTAPLKTAIFGLVDVPLHSSTRIYGAGNLGFQEFYHFKKAESFLRYYKRWAITTRVFYSRSVGSCRLAPSQLAQEEMYLICWVKVCLLHEGIIISRSRWRFSPPQQGLSW